MILQKLISQKLTAENCMHTKIGLMQTIVQKSTTSIRKKKEMIAPHPPSRQVVKRQLAKAELSTETR